MILTCCQRVIGFELMLYALESICDNKSNEDLNGLNFILMLDGKRWDKMSKTMMFCLKRRTTIISGKIKMQDGKILGDPDGTPLQFS